MSTISNPQPGPAQNGKGCKPITKEQIKELVQSDSFVSALHMLAFHDHPLRIERRLGKLLDLYMLENEHDADTRIDYYHDVRFLREMLYTLNTEAQVVQLRNQTNA